MTNGDRSLFTALPMWVQGVAMVGVPSLIAFILLGVVPGVPSPIDRLEHALSDHNQATASELEKNREVQKAMVQVLRAICYRLPNSGQLPKCE